MMASIPASAGKLTCPRQKRVSDKFMPLINMKPADHNTVNTAIANGIKVTKESNQEYLVITADQQIYKVIIDILFNEPSLLVNVVAVLGGMHFLMDFISSLVQLEA